MNSKQKIWEVMTSDLKTVGLNTPISVIKQIFKNNNFHHIPVEDKIGEIMGIISSADLSRSDSFPQNESQLEARHIMTASLDTVMMDTPIAQVVNTFLEKNYRALPVLDSSNVFVGLVTTHDLLRCLAEANQSMKV